MFDLHTVLDHITSKPVMPAPQQATFSIPADHPAADKLLRMMAHLQTATVTPSGLHLQHREDDPAAVEEILDTLHSVLLAEGAEVPPLAEFVRQQKLRAQPLSIGQLFQTVMQVLGGGFK